MISALKKWWDAEEAVAAIEAAMLIPVMFTMLIGSIDLGCAFNISQKVVNSSSMIADLLSREEEVTDTEFTEAVVAGELAFTPYATDSMGYDVAGIQFLTAAKTPTVQWRETYNMDPNGNVTTDSEGLGDENEGVVAVTVRYVYEPFFSYYIVGEFGMQETFYMRGRRSAYVSRT